MDKARLERIKEQIAERTNFAERTLDGDTDGYDGADGAREVRDLCSYCNELIAELEKVVTVT